MFKKLLGVWKAQVFEALLLRQYLMMNTLIFGHRITELIITEHYPVMLAWPWNDMELA